MPVLYSDRDKFLTDLLCDFTRKIGQDLPVTVLSDIII